MKRAILCCCLALAVSAPAVAQQPTQSGAAAPPAETMAKGQLDGKFAATNVGTGGWFGGGLASGVLLGLIGTAVTWAIAGSSNVDLPPEKAMEIASQPTQYKTMYEKGYGDEVHKKRKSSALKGGLLGTAALILLVLSAGSSQ